MEISINIIGDIPAEEFDEFKKLEHHIEYTGITENYPELENIRCEVRATYVGTHEVRDIFDKVTGYVKGYPTPWNIGFLNRDGEEDETQLDSDSDEDLRELWRDLHDEFNADFDHILYIQAGKEESC